jgi:aryl-alcohol dehydrogenase-like predicted oxidoreductase
MPLPTRKIGSTEVSALGYGAMGISAFYGSVESDEERFKVGIITMRSHNHLTQWLQVLDAVYEQGCTFWDTADVYMDSEDLIGKWYDEIFICVISHD